MPFSFKIWTCTWKTELTNTSLELAREFAKVAGHKGVDKASIFFKNDFLKNQQQAEK